MTYEDFETFTVVDEGADITVDSATKITVDSMIKNVDSYVYKDYGSEHFGDFEHLLKFHDTSVAGTSDGLAYMYVLSNGANHTIADVAAANEGIGIYIANAYAVLTLRCWETDDADTVNLDNQTDYWLTISRSGTTVALDVYTDATRETLFDSISITSTTTTFRNLGVVGSREAIGTEHNSFTVEDLDLQEVVAPIVRRPRMPYGLKPARVVRPGRIGV